MRANPAFPRHSGLTTVITSAAATLIVLGILIGTTMLFQSRGKPMAELAAAERAVLGRPTSQIANAACANGWPRHTAIASPTGNSPPIADVRGPMQSNTLRFVPETAP